MRRWVDGVVTAVDHLSVDVELHADDLRALARLTSADPQRPDSRQLYWSLRAALWIILIIASALHPFVWLAVAVEAGVVLVEQRARRRGRPPRAVDLMNGRYTVLERGLSRTSVIGETTIAWGVVEQLSQTGDHVCIRFSGTGWVLPVRCFSSEDHRREFVAAVQRHVNVRPPGTVS